jgi:hypothetical protein
VSPEGVFSTFTAVYIGSEEGEFVADMSLQLAKEIVASIAPGFNGDARLAALALQRLFAVIRKYDDDEAKSVTKDIVVAMGPQMKGNVDNTCEAFERILASVVIAKRQKATTKLEVMPPRAEERSPTE